MSQLEDLKKERERRKERERQLALQGNLQYPKMRTGLQGLTLGFGDEIEAGLRNPGLLWGSDKSRREYGEDIANIRGDIGSYRELHPGRSAALEVGGAVLPLLGSMAAAPFTGGGSTVPAAATASRVPGLLKTMAKAGGWGAAEGTAYGVGTQEGNLSQRDFINTQGGIGAGIGALTPPVLRGLGGMYRSARNPMSSAERSLEGLLRNDEISVGEILASRNLDKPQVLADLAGENSRRRLAALESIPGPQRGVIAGQLKDRQAGQAERAIQDIEVTTQVPLKDTDELLRSISASRSARARPLYDAAYEAGENIDDPAIIGLMNRPDFRNAFEEGKVIYDAENAAKLLRGEDPLPDLIDLPEGAVSFNLRGLDNIYRGMRSQADQAFRAGNNSLGRALKEQANALRDRLDGLVPEYGRARAVFKSDSEMLESLQEGQKFMSAGKTSTRSIRNDLAGLDDGQKEVYRLGAIDAIRQAIHKGAREGSNIQSRFFGTKEMRDRLRLMFPEGAAGDNSYNELMNRLNQENQMQQTLKETQGSRTTPLGEEVQKQLAEESFMPDPKFLEQFGNRPVRTTLDRTLGAGYRGAMQGVPSTRRELAGLLTDPVAQRMPSSTVGNEWMPSQSPILSPKMKQFMENLNRATRRRKQQTGLLDQYSGPLGGQLGLWGAIGSNR